MSKLPALYKKTLPQINNLVNYFGIPRDALASDEDIKRTWDNLPHELKNIPDNLRNHLIARMCVAVSTGLFDGAMNYIWNASILHLRERIRIFGLPVVDQILQKGNFEEKDLLSLQDNQLIDLYYKLNLINEEGYYFLQHNRDLRNHFSAAHPTIGNINSTEFLAFLNRCVNYALADSSSPTGVNPSNFIDAINGIIFTNEQTEFWIESLSKTHDSQRQILVSMLHGMYCDSAKTETSRKNVIKICKNLQEKFTSSIKSDLINNHHEYVVKGKSKKQKASAKFFEEIGALNLLNNTEKHNIYSKAIERLQNVHENFDNFYNEPPFAEYLYEISQQIPTRPDNIKEAYVLTIACCKVGNGCGNGSGVCTRAVRFYNEMIKDFTAIEITILIRLAKIDNNAFGVRLKTKKKCRENSYSLFALIDEKSIPVPCLKDYKDLKRLHTK